MFGSSRASMLMGNDLARKVLKAKATKTSALNVAPSSLATAEASTIWQEQDQLQILMEKRRLHILIVALLPHLLHQLDPYSSNKNGDAIVGATVQVLLEKALSLATDKIGLVFGFKDELESMRESIVMIQALLADAENKQSHNKAVQLWLRRLEGVAFDADHMLDELQYETLRHKVVNYRNQQVKGSKLGKLSDDDCWSILTRKASKNGELPQELIVMKQQILRRCSGLPLAASVLGGLLRVTREDEWLSIVKKKLLTIKEDGNSVQQILKLSFDNLPTSSIKTCFTYCSVFPKDATMQKNLLIELWMAEGFLQPCLNDQSTMEDIGDQYIRIFLQASLLEEGKYHGDAHYKMHDLVHDLAEIISTSKLENGEMDNHNQVPYLALNSSDGMTVKIVRDMSISVRTLFLKDKSFDMLPKFKNLYVLNLDGAYLKELPTSIGELIVGKGVPVQAHNIRVSPGQIYLSPSTS
nr:putative disease resistance protein RGA3 [Coffea arabica]